MNKQCTETQTISKPPAGLYIVATPIGHSEDITLRALNILKHVDSIICEDTRVTKKLLNIHCINTRLQRYNDFSTDYDREHIIQQLEQSQSIALVSDAGTPLISDPGYKLIQACYEKDIPITSLPGACAAITALTLSGLPSNRFLFEGFLPNKSHARQKQLSLLASINTTLIFYESAKRLIASLTDMAACLGEKREASVSRELTKTYEEVRNGTLAELAAHYTDKGHPKGEIIITVAPPTADTYSTEDILNLLTEYLSTLSVKDAVQHVSEITGRPRKEVYQIAIKMKE